MSFVKPFLVSLLGLVHTLPVSAEQRQFGNTVYTPLPGWDAGNNSDGKLVFLSNLPDDLCEYCYIHLSASQPGRGNLSMYLTREMLRFVDVEDKESATAIGDQSPISLAGHDALMQGLKIGSTVQVVVAVSLGDRFELFGFQGAAYGDDDLSESMGVFQSQIIPFFNRLTFVSDGVSPVMPAPQPGNLEGVWWGWSTYSTFGLDMMMRQEMDYRSLFFWPDGYFYDGTPPDGLAAINPDGLQARADANYGVYTASGGTLTLTFATGEVEELKSDGEGWVDSQKTLTKVQPLPDGTVLKGGISSFFYTGFTPGSGVEGGISSSSSTDFFADGTYNGQSFGGTFGNFDAGGGFSTSTDGATGGTYIVQGGMVISTPNNGGPPTAALALRLDDENILIGDQFLETGN